MMADYIELLAAHDRFEAERDRLRAVVAKLVGALGTTIDLAIWMSGADDFAPGQPAHEGWQKAAAHLDAARDALARAKEIG